MPVLPAQRISVGGAVVGFTNVAGTYRAYNLDATTFAVAYGALNPGGAADTLYSCGHGAGPADRVDIENGCVDVNETAGAQGCTGADDSPFDVHLKLAAGGTDQVDIENGCVDVNETAVPEGCTGADDLANVLLFGKGGVIFLDGGRAFDGFQYAARGTGTAATVRSAYPTDAAAGGPLAAPAAAVAAHLHHCFTQRDPDGARAAMQAVSVTLDGVDGAVGGGVLTIAHDHLTKATVSVTLGLDDGPAGGAPTVPQLQAAEKAIQPVLLARPFLTEYAAAQTAINNAPGVGAGVITLHLTYADTGSNPDPPGELTQELCLSVGGVGGSAELPDVADAPLEMPDSSGPGAGVTAGIVGAVAAGAIAVGGAAWYARRRWLRR